MVGRNDPCGNDTARLCPYLIANVCEAIQLDLCHIQRVISNVKFGVHLTKN